MWRGTGLFLLCLVTFTAGLGRSAIQDSDEAFYAEAGREMLVSGDWVTPHYNFEPRLQKPILYYWLVAGTYRVIGVNEAAARFWAAISGLALAFVAYGAGKRWIDANVGLLGGVIVATSLGIVPFARQSLPDMPLAFFVSVTIWAMLEALAREPIVDRRSIADRRRWSPQAWLYLAAVSAALGVLTKGPVAIALPVMVLAPLMIWEWRARRPAGISFELRPQHLGIAAVLFLLLATPWYVAVADAQGVQYWRQFFVGENVERFATSQFNEWRGWFYLPIIIVGLLPWSMFGWLWLNRRNDRAPRGAVASIDRRLVSWALGPLAFFMISVGSQPRYILPCLVPLALLLARTIWTRASADRRDWPFSIAAAGAAGAISVIGLLIARAAPLLRAVDPEWSMFGAGLVIAAGVITLIATVAAPQRYVPGAIAVAATIAVLAMQFAVLSPRRPEPVETFARVIEQYKPMPEVCACGAFARSLVFYTHLKTIVTDTDEEVRTFLSRPERVLAAVEAGTLARVEASLSTTFPRLAEVRYIDSGERQQPATVINPDPRAVKHVILIRNR